MVLSGFLYITNSECKNNIGKVMYVFMKGLFLYNYNSCIQFSLYYFVVSYM